MQEESKVKSLNKDGSIFIATPCYGQQVTSGYMMSVLGATICSADNLQFTIMHIGDDALLPRVRSTLLSAFLEQSDFSHLLFVDADISFDASAPAKLLQSGKDFIGGLYPLRERYWDQQTRTNMIAGEKPETASLRYVGATQAMRETPSQGGILRVPYVGMGFMMVSRSAIEKMVKSYPELEYKRIDAVESGEGRRHYALFDCMIDKATGTYLSEDFSFCKRWTDIDGEIWADPSIILKHTGPASFSGNPELRVGIDCKTRRAS